VGKRVKGNDSFWVDSENGKKVQPSGAALLQGGAFLAGVIIIGVRKHGLLLTQQAGIEQVLREEA